MGGLGLFLAWQVVTRSLVAYLANAAPQRALSLRSEDPVALLNLADGTLNRPHSTDGREQVRAAGGAPQARPEGDEASRLREWADLLSKAANSGQSRSSEGTTEPTDPAAQATVSPESREQIRKWAELALSRDPLSARAMRILGQAGDAAADEARVAKFMRATVVHSIRESIAVDWLMQKSYDEKDYAMALYCADVLLRTRPVLLPRVMPVLAKMAENTSASSELKALLATNPPWRRRFLTALPRYISDARTPLEFLLALRDTASPPAAEDLRDYLRVLINNNFYELAYYTWLQFLPPNQLTSAGQPFNGDFEITPSGLPFDWAMPRGKGVIADIMPRPDDSKEHALSIEFGLGRVEFEGVSQIMLLAAGTYQFKANYKAEIVGRRGLVWRVSCVHPTLTPLGSSAMIVGKAPDWKEIEFTFTVPDTDCPAQQLRLFLDARSASEQLVSGWSWHDDVRIVRSATQ